ncbi:DNA helicase RecQ [Mangrovimonas aestuarii]|uniref:DNA helicase RecQ n=1 Tax=Mangrovimonas aestuarii TaxID=3018443 RepID=UPI002377E945|nr:DNA helicase RecQ [Mangrovimonas aestuarii]
MAIKPIQSDIHNTLKQYFGYDTFRATQQDIVESVLSKSDCLVIMPTGGGKSICFQLPALLFPGVTVVISPLIALMKDQVDGLLANGIPAAFFNSSQDVADQERVLDRVARAEIKLLYVAPESLAGLENVLKESYISCLAIDEAHCISSWGPDFRPSYQQLGFLKKQLPNTPIIALTATADKATRQDIVNQLNISHAKQFISSFDRKNIEIEVRPADGRTQQIVRFIKKRPNQSGIVYCLSRKNTEQLAQKLSDNGIPAKAYHAGLSFEERTRIQEDFIFDDSQVICATIAFGMGIDKSNVRWVIHHNMPKNIEGYYQEIGRAGRDGLPSYALLFHSYADVIQLQKFAKGSSNEAVQLAKLDRMKQFSEATTCRRKILLGYFGELLEENCGNCDICKNPPQFFDGTIIAQKILSTIARANQNEAIGTIIDVLRGARNTNIIEKALDGLSTYGIGQDISWKDWQHYIVQLINQGYCEIAFHDHNNLQLTHLANKVLFQSHNVLLTHAVHQSEAIAKPKKPKPIKQAQDNNLFERLRKLRYKIAQEEDIPPYLVFNDATLKEMEQVRPMSESEFLTISGVGQRKLEVYGDEFIAEIIDFMASKRKKPRKKDTYLETFKLYESGCSVEEIAQKRKLNQTTIYSHIAKLYLDGKEINIYDFVSKSEIQAVKQAKVELNNPSVLKPYFEHFNEQLDYFKIRLALSVIERG